MCGIAGIVGSRTTEALPLIKGMLDTMPYRGPDDRGVWGEGDMTLGHLRLSIIDRSSGGHQPMVSEDGSFVLVFNGEIFNYLELRDELISLGSSFHTRSDTEVLLEAYRQWGVECVERFNGMWAFALWDRRKKQLFCARDRFGIKPFYYRLNGHQLSFASEMKALLSLRSAEPDWQYYYHFFDRRTSLGCDRTVFRDILHLRPGHTLVWQAGVVTIRPFWEYDPDAFRARMDDGDPVVFFRELFVDAVRLRLRSDVPVGVCLSGGIDSSAIAVVLAQLGVIPHTFSTVYVEPDYNEAIFIDAVNTATDARAHRITPSPGDFFPILDQIVRHHDEPVRMPGVFSHWCVMQCAAPHVTVLLDGQGADEIMGGYNDYFPSLLAEHLRRILHLRHPLHSTRALFETLQALPREKGIAAFPLLREALVRFLPQLRQWRARPRQKDHLFTAAFCAQYAYPFSAIPEEEVLLGRAPTLLDAEMYRTFRETNLPMLLRYEDRNSMAFSLEARTPFLDYRIVEFCAALPIEWKIRGAETKRIVRAALHDLLPPLVRSRRDKKGFPTPLTLWMRGPLRAELRRRLENGAFLDAGVIEGSALRLLLDEHLDGVADHERTLFRLLTLDRWMRLSR